MESLQSLLSKDSNIKSTVAQAETAIKLMRANGYGDQADLFESEIRNSIVNKNGKAFSGNVSQLFAFQKKASIPKPKPKESEPDKIAPENALMQIENALNMGDERGIKLSDQDIKSAAFAYGKGDLKGAAKIANKLVERIDTAIKLQDEEEKDVRTTAEGIQVAIGKKTGTVYTGGIPASRGRQNTESFSSFLGEKRKEDIATIPGVGAITQALPEGFTPAPEISQLETIKPQPELYSQQTKPEQMSALREKEAAFNEARALYYSGKNNEALALINAAGGKGFMGGDYTPDDLERVFGQKPQQPPANQTAPQRPPLSGIIPIPQIPENK